MTHQTLIFEKTGPIGRITLNRPKTGNAVTEEMASELGALSSRINDDSEIRVVIVTGSQDVFSSNFHASESQDTSAGAAAAAIAAIRAPVIAAVNGEALGAGLELALSSDIRFAAEKARFGLPEVAHGSIPAGGGTQRLPRIVGRGKALEMILAAEIIDAAEAFRIGLVNKVVPLAELLPSAEALANKIATKGPIAERYAKEALGKGMDMSLGQGLGLEADLSFLLQSTKDRAEGISAFLQKRTPEFKGE